MSRRLGAKVELWLEANIPAHPELGADRLLDRMQEELPAEEPPSAKTVGRRIAMLRDRSGRWQLTSSEPAPRQMIEVLSAVATVWPHRPYLTIAEADWIRTIRAAAPDLGPLDTCRVAIAYLGRAKRGRDASDIDLFLAMGPWRSQEAADRYDAGGPFTMFADTPTTMLFLPAYPDGTDSNGRWTLEEDGSMRLLPAFPGHPDPAIPQD